MMSTTLMTTSFTGTVSDDERRAPMGLTERDRCRRCNGPIHRTDLSGLCWSCMPTC
jgi:hypothetical protein